MLIAIISSRILVLHDISECCMHELPQLDKGELST